MLCTLNQALARPLPCRMWMTLCATVTAEPPLRASGRMWPMRSIHAFTRSLPPLSHGFKRRLRICQQRQTSWAPLRASAAHDACSGSARSARLAKVRLLSPTVSSCRRCLSAGVRSISGLQSCRSRRSTLPCPKRCALRAISSLAPLGSTRRASRRCCGSVAGILRRHDLSSNSTHKRSYSISLRLYGFRPNALDHRCSASSHPISPCGRMPTCAMSSLRPHVRLNRLLSCSSPTVARARTRRQSSSLRTSQGQSRYVSRRLNSRANATRRHQKPMHHRPLRRCRYGRASRLLFGLFRTGGARVSRARSSFHWRSSCGLVSI